MAADARAIRSGDGGDEGCDSSSSATKPRPFGEGVTAGRAGAGVLLGLDTLGIVLRKGCQETGAIGNVQIHETPPRRDNETPLDPIILPDVINFSPFHQKIRSSYRDCYKR